MAITLKLSFSAVLKRELNKQLSVKKIEDLL